MHCYLFLLLPRPLRRQAAVFDTPQNILALAEELSQKPVAIETAMSLHDLIGSGAQALAGDDDPTSQNATGRVTQAEARCGWHGWLTSVGSQTRMKKAFCGLGRMPFGNRRSTGARIFPNQESALRLTRALAVEIHEGWIEAHRYLNMEMLREQRKQLQLLEAA
jgi:hypothetical protein